MKFSCLILLLLILVGTSCKSDVVSEGKTYAHKQEIPKLIDFNFHVKPILSDRCYTCHGPDESKMEGGLRLDTEEGAFVALGKEKDRFAIVAGKPDSSELVHRIYTTDPDDIMPPPESNLTLSDYEKAILKRWIEQGAQWKKHWAFLPPVNNIPEVSDELNFIVNDIDKFILSKLKENNIAPSAQAEPDYLIRRLSFDLTGLPPTIEDLDTYSDDLDSYIDKLLASDAYAERMTAEWLDLARYSDTHGYQDDLERVMWPWRDWVIHSYKNNLPYDKFVRWQLAGDLLPEPTKEMIVATAFNRNHKITQEGGVVPEEYRVEYVSDRTQTFGTAFLGLSVECAKCHDHKYDPISQKDYFSLYAFFNSVPEKGLIQPYGAIPEPYLEIKPEDIKEQLAFINNVDTMESIPLMIMEDMEEPRETFVLGRGAYDNPTVKVFPNTPKSVLAFGDDLPPNRLGLSEWLFDDQNPITARVAVNRIWQIIFGEGIVSTSYDFGNQGALPSHPELLDHLAIKFKAMNWDQKALIKYIVSSATYQQSSKIKADIAEIDPENKLLSRSPRKRLTAEMIRDQALASSGLLNRIVGGPSVKPYQPAGIWAEKTGGGGRSTAKYVEDSGDKLYRRSIYTFWKRTVPPPSMMTFDAASRDFCIVKRQSTSTPLQALVLLNDPQITEAARVISYKALSANDNIESSVKYIFRSITSRLPSEEELLTLLNFYKESEQDFESDKERMMEFLAVGEYEIEYENKSELAALSTVALAIFNLDESISLS
ncbi:PSD1 and planctomycete cytochrome C domain-containing protein [Portibacter lacus]|uniref:DUF1553 domain-containing protein n=1 Tax=Portibacter lacus TaxID=1099794 RepID=A0AA37WDR8_9BACT|nr:PSD1 and planctomycete cytochrome C domain-containing protein [Portibacter lacus]GLR15854.1 hypothetical protein GCM10007940_04690 [Portibacter lacus]